MPLTPLMSCRTDDLGGAEGFEAVHEGNADVDFCGLSVGGEPLTRHWSERVAGGRATGPSDHRRRRTAMMRSPKAFRQRIFASIRLRAWYPVQRFQKALPWYRVARRVSFPVRAAGQSSFQRRPFLRIGMIGVPCRLTMAVWQRRVS